MIRSRVVRRAAVAVAALALLSGCGHQPGAAFQVGDRAVSQKTVDQVVAAQCRLIADSGQAANPNPRSKAVWVIVDRMVQATVVLAYADHVGASYSAADLRKATAQLDQATAKLPADEREAFTSALTDALKSDLLATSIGTDDLKKRGATSPTPEAARSRGLVLAHTWAERQGISIDPRFNLGTSDKAGAGDGSISVPVTTFAKSAAAGSAKRGFTSGLPAGQLCG